MDDKIETTAEHVENNARRHGAAAMTVSDTPTTPEQEPLPEAIARKPVDQKSPAEWAYQRLILYIKNFEKMLDAEEEIAMGFTDTGSGFLRIEGLGYFDPDIITFYGTDQTGTRVQLVQHVSQLNFLLRATPKAREDDAPRRIGFELAKALEDDVS